MTHSIENSVLVTFIRRLNNLGIHIELNANIPWIYIKSINNIKVTEKFKSEKGFTAFYYPVKLNQKIRFSNRSTVFNLIRIYTKRT